VQTVDPKTKTSLGLQAGVETRLLEHPGILIALGRVRVARRARSRSRPRSPRRSRCSAARARPPTSCAWPRTRCSRSSSSGLENVDGLAAQIGRSWILTGNPSQWVADLAEFEKITAADVQRVVKSYLAPSRATVVIIPPAARPVAPAAAPAATAPAPATPVAPKTGGAS
jgi:hypothetical protein